VISNVTGAGPLDPAEDGIQLISYNKDKQFIQAMIDVQSSWYIAKLVLSVDPNSFSSATNSLESLFTTMVAMAPDEAPGAVPLPGALVLMGSALAACAGAVKWRERCSRDANT
jgi:hypothetical protein